MPVRVRSLLAFLQPRPVYSVLLPPEGAPFCEASFPPRGLAEDGGTADAQHNSLSVTEHRGDLVAAWTFDIHKVGIWRLDESFLFVSPPLQLGARV